jgi:hypothetical protein
MSAGHEEHFEVEQEPDTVHKVGAALIAAGGFAWMAIGVVIAAAIWVGYVHARRPGYAVPPPAGTLERTPIDATLRGPDYDAKRREDLTRWGWVDRANGVARIPIDEAKAIVRERAR